MDPQFWQRVKDVFHHVIELEVAARPAYIEQACADDAVLRREIESLLASHQEAEGFIEDSVLSRAGAHPEADNALVGRSLGAYRILRQIGHGGMGTVYLAERGDDQYRQRVAVKLLKLGMESEFMIARFRQERQILATLDHPSIARLLDGGTFDDGRPYLVMEYIEGEPIDLYCARRELSIRETVKLFRQVCDAVQYAHRSLVIHRDLKPSNILVSVDGTPKLLDFGTAKLLDSSGLEPPATATGMRLMTPEFASPEQLRAEQVTTASDVYTLGVVLYRLLTGCPPYYILSPLSPEAVRVVCEEEPLPPSTVGGSRDVTTHGPRPDPRDASQRRRRHLSGDLDNIVMMALRKEPERRYASVEQLSEDLRRTLADLPVFARPDTLAYRASKFVRRHRAGVAAAALVFLVLTGGLVGTLWQAKKAKLNLALAEEVKGFLMELFEVSDPAKSKGRTISAREMLDRGAGKLDRGLRRQPQFRAALLDTVGLIYHKLGDDEQAAVLLEKALEAYGEVDGEQLQLLGPILIHLGYVRRDRKEFELAGELFRRATELSPPNSKLAAEALNGLGTFYYKVSEYEEARATHEQALTIRRRLADPTEKGVAESLQNLGTVLYALGDFAGAEQHLKAALEIRLDLDAIDPDVATNLNNLAAVIYRQERFEEAGELAEESLQMSRQLYAARDHYKVADSLDNLALMRSAVERMDEAERLHRAALEMRLRLFGPGDPDVGLSYHNLGVLYNRQDDLDQSAAYYRQALEVWTAAEKPPFESIRVCRLDLARVFLARGDHRAAMQELELLEESERQASGAESFEPSAELEALRRELRPSGDSPKAPLSRDGFP